MGSPPEGEFRNIDGRKRTGRSRGGHDRNGRENAQKVGVDVKKLRVMRVCWADRVEAASDISPMSETRKIRVRQKPFLGDLKYIYTYRRKDT